MRTAVCVRAVELSPRSQTTRDKCASSATTPRPLRCPYCPPITSARRARCRSSAPIPFQLQGTDGICTFIPTPSSWLNLDECWFKELTDKRLRRARAVDFAFGCRGRFTSVTNLAEALELWADHWNNNPRPFTWTKTADEIITEVSRCRNTLHQLKSATQH